MNTIMEIKDVNIDSNSLGSQLVLYSSSKGVIRGIFNSEFKLTQYNLLTNEIEAIEVLNRKGREQIQKFYNDNPQYMSLNPNSLLTSLKTNDSEKVDEIRKSSLSNSTKSQTQRKNSITKSIASDATQKSMNMQKIDMCNLFNSFSTILEKYGENDARGL